MTDQKDKLARIKGQIAKAAGEINHGDSYTAVLALCDALGAMLQYLETQTQVIDRITQKLETDYKGIDALLHRLEEQMAIYPKGEEVKEPEPIKSRIKK